MDMSGALGPPLILGSASPRLLAILLLLYRLLQTSKRALASRCLSISQGASL